MGIIQCGPLTSQYKKGTDMEKQAEQRSTVTEGPEPVVCEQRGDKSFFSVEEKRPSCLPTLSWKG